MFIDANAILTAGDFSEKDAFKSLTVGFSNFQVVITIANDK